MLTILEAPSVTCMGRIFKQFFTCIAACDHLEPSGRIVNGLFLTMINKLLGWQIRVFVGVP